MSERGSAPPQEGGELAVWLERRFRRLEERIAGVGAATQEIAPKTPIELLRSIAADDNFGSAQAHNMAEHMSLGSSIEQAWPLRAAPPTDEMRHQHTLAQNIEQAVVRGLQRGRASGARRGGRGRRGRGRGGRGQPVLTGVPTCARCGRAGHLATHCFATSRADGTAI